MTDSFFLLFIAAVLIVGASLYLFISFTKKTGKQLNRQQYQGEWLKIQRQLSQPGVTNFAMAVLDADKLLDRALRERGFKGQTMGERMKSAAQTWTNANAVWGAHKLRNRIAHETNVTVEYKQAAGALSAFRQALTDVGAI